MNGAMLLPIIGKAILQTVCCVSILVFGNVPANAQTSTDEDVLVEHANKPWTGDLDGMVKRGFIRFLTVHNPLFFGIDGKNLRGIAVDVGEALEKHLRKTLGPKGRGINVVFIAVQRDQLLPGLISGRGDIAGANLTITPARKELVAFSNPTYPNVMELLVTGPAAPAIESFDDLISTPIHIRTSSSYFEHISSLNHERKMAGKKPLNILNADERLEDYDLLEMVNAGIIPETPPPTEAQWFYLLTLRPYSRAVPEGPDGCCIRGDQLSLRNSLATK